MKYALFVRVSTDRQTTENQVTAIQDFCHSQKWEEAACYSVNDNSGSRQWRTIVEHMIEDAGRRKFDVVVFWSLDRLSREGALDCMEILQRLANYGVKYRSLQEPYLDTTQAFGDVIVAFVATMAKMERERIRERTKAGMDRARAKGVRIGKPRAVVDIAFLANRRQAGASIRDLATAFEISTATVIRRLREWDQKREAIQNGRMAN